MTDVPIIGKIYDYFDDGKIRESRRSPVIITEVIPFENINNHTKKFWKREVKECPWLYANTTDYFVKGIITNHDKSTENVIFVRTIKNEWFSLGFLTAGLLAELDFWEKIKIERGYL